MSTTKFPLPLLRLLRRYGTRFYHFLRLLYSKFTEDNCLQRASSLSFSTLLALVPLTAFIFALFTGFNVFTEARQQLQQFLIQVLVPTRQEEIMTYIQQFIDNSRTLGVIGLLVFAVTSLILLHGITRNLNAIWNSSAKSGGVRTFSTYLSVIVFGTMLIAASFAFTRTVRTFFEELPHFSTLSRWFIEFAPFLFIFIAIWLIITLVPSAKVRLGSSLVGALAGTILWEIARYAFVDGTNYVIRISVIYGSIAAIPIFLIWLSINWLIILTAAEISYVHQHRDVEHFDELFISGTPGARLLTGLKVYFFIARRFLRGEAHPSLREISHSFSINIRDTEMFLRSLEHSGLLLRTSGHPHTYIPARDLGSTPVSEVLNTLSGRIPFETPPDLADTILHRALESGFRLYKSTTVAEALDAQQ